LRQLCSHIRQLLRRRIVANALSLYGIQGLNYLMPLILLPYLLRVLGPSGYGPIALAQSLMGYGLVLTDFGFNSTAARDISVARDDPRAMARIYWTTAAAKLLLLLVSALALAAAVAAIPAFRREWPIFLSCSLMLVGNAAFPQWYLHGLERLREAALLQACAKVSIAAGTFLFVHAPQDAWKAAVLTSAPQLLGLTAAAILRKPIAPAIFYRPRLSDVRDALAGSWHLFISTVATTLYGQTNTLVLGLMAGDRAVALYNVAERLVLALQGLATPLTQAVFPRASLLFATDRARAWRLIERMVGVILPVIGGSALLLAVFAPTVVRLIGGHAYDDAATVVRIMAITPVLVAAGALPAQMIIVSARLTRQLFRIYATVGLLNVALLPALVYTLHERGAAISLVIADSLVALLMIRLAAKARDVADDGGRIAEPRSVP